MSDDEKKAVEIVKEIKDIRGMRQDVEGEDEDLCALDTIVNLIEKQSKEIEELKEDNKHQWEERCKLTFELENSTSNDKIKAKIEEINKEMLNEENSLELFYRKKYCKEVLQSLLDKE